MEHDSTALPKATAIRLERVPLPGRAARCSVATGTRRGCSIPRRPVAMPSSSRGCSAQAWTSKSCAPTRFATRATTRRFSRNSRCPPFRQRPERAFDRRVEPATSGFGRSARSAIGAFGTMREAFALCQVGTHARYSSDDPTGHSRRQQFRAGGRFRPRRRRRAVVRRAHFRRGAPAKGVVR